MYAARVKGAPPNPMSGVEPSSRTAVATPSRTAWAPSAQSRARPVESVQDPDTFTYQDKKRYFIDTINGYTYTSNELNMPKQTMWVFDDMIIGMTESGIKAFVPASS